MDFVTLAESSQRFLRHLNDASTQEARPLLTPAAEAELFLLATNFLLCTFIAPACCCSLHGRCSHAMYFVATKPPRLAFAPFLWEHTKRYPREAAQGRTRLLMLGGSAAASAPKLPKKKTV